MAYFLCIETSTTLCSVAICNEQNVLAVKEENNGYTHAENLHVFIDHALKEAGIKINDLSAIAVGKGPGSYTGLRIGVSTAKGLAYTLNIPLISCNSLQTMAYQAAEMVKIENAILCPMLDARRMEVYTALYNSKTLGEIEPTHAYIFSDTSIEKFISDRTFLLFGDGIEKTKDLLGTLPNIKYLENIFPSAFYMQREVSKSFLSGTFENVAYFEPFYLKEFYTGSN